MDRQGWKRLAYKLELLALLGAEGHRLRTAGTLQPQRSR
jgi:hypothetical protein